MNKLSRICIPCGATIKEAMQAIGAGEIGAVFVHDNENKFSRIITDGDIRRVLLSGHGLESSIETIPSQKAVVVYCDTPLDKVTGLFNDKIRLIPVLGNQGNVVDYHMYDKRQHIAVAKPIIDSEELQLVSECVITGWVSSGGKFVTQFEEKIAEYCNVQHAVACSSGTSALHLSLIANDIGPGDEVIVPSLTFVATANAVTYSGAKPVFADCMIDSWTMDVSSIKQLINNNTKAIIPVHLYGHPVDMDPLLELAHEYNLLVIEDAAEAHGALYKGRQVGSLSDIGVFSFFGNKIITTGEGGMITTNNAELAEKCRLYRDHGMSKNKRYWHEVVGYNYRMTNLQAALGVAQMSKIESIIERKKSIAERYRKGLENIPGIILPVEKEWATNVYWLYTILLDEQECGLGVDELMDILGQNSIESRPVFPPMHMQPIYKNEQSLPVSEQIAKTGISLPSSADIRNHEIDDICSIIEQALT